MKHTRRTVLISGCVVLCVLFCLLYWFYLRDWECSVPVNLEVVQGIDYFQDRSQEECDALFSAVDRIGKEAHTSDDSIRYRRRVCWEKAPSCLSIDYTFFRSADDPLFERSDLLSHDDASWINVLIYPRFMKDMIYTEDLSSLMLATDEAQIKKEMSKEYGRFRPIYNLFVQKGKTEDFSYYITPYNRTKNEYGMADGDDCVAYAFLRFGEYQINLYEHTHDGKRYQCLPLVLQDLADLFREAQKAS